MPGLKRCAGWAVLVGVAGALLIAGLTRPQRRDADPSTMARWEPTAAEVLREVGSGPPVAGDGRSERFAEMLTQRYRSRFLAVRVIMREADFIEVRCGANMTRRLMACVAVQVGSEAERVFGRPVRLDVYETYVAVPKRKVAELHPASRDRRARLVFDERAWTR